tara:strand:+ start:187 stop:756 length:570 start_codon:yes stop_codon:yes gene_type:complete
MTTTMDNNKNTMDDLNRAGFLMIIKRDAPTRKGYYVEYCNNMKVKLETIKRDPSNRVHKYFRSTSLKPAEHFLKYDQEGEDVIGLDYDTWWEANNFKLYTEEKLFNHFPFLKDENVNNSIKLCRIIDCMTAKEKWTCYNATLRNWTNAKVKKEFRRMAKIPCPFCGRIISKYNMARHKSYFCKIINKNL